MASAKVMAKLQADQSSITQLAELHSKQGSSLSNSSPSSRKANVPPRWLQSPITTSTQHSHKVNAPLLSLDLTKVY